jgi:hypothetical protein
MKKYCKVDVKLLHLWHLINLTGNNATIGGLIGIDQKIFCTLGILPDASNLPVFAGRGRKVIGEIYATFF